MCGLAGIINFKNSPLLNLEMSLKVMNNLQKHRGPDGEADGGRTGRLAAG